MSPGEQVYSPRTLMCAHARTCVRVCILVITKAGTTACPHMEEDKGPCGQCKNKSPCTSLAAMRQPVQADRPSAHEALVACTRIFFIICFSVCVCVCVCVCVNARARAASSTPPQSLQPPCVTILCLVCVQSTARAQPPRKRPRAGFNAPNMPPPPSQACDICRRCAAALRRLGR